MSWRARLTPSFKTRMALAMVAVVAALGFATRRFVEERLAGDLEQELEERAITFAHNLAADSVEPILYHDVLAVETLLRRSRTSWQDFEYGYVVDATGRVFAHTMMGEFPSELRRLNRFRGGEHAQIERIEALGYRYRDVAVPIRHGSLGVLHLGFRDKSIVDRLAALRVDIVVVLAIVAALSALAAYGLTWLGLRPLQRIVDALEGLRPGRRRIETGLRRNDEVGDVARRVDEVTLRLHQTQIALDQETRLAAVGRFSSVIAHEVGNPLASLMTRLDLMERSDEERFVRDSLPLLRGQLGRIQKLVRGLSQMSRARRTEVCTCDLREPIRDAYELIRMDPGASTVRFDLDLDDLAPVRCVHDQLFQVLVNVGLNAVRAAGAGGRVAITTGTSQGGDFAHVDIEDSGPGVPEEDRARIFEPFFSTHSSGTGLGLTISRDLMRQQGGDLLLVSGRGSGACFRVRIPIAGPDGEGGASIDRGVS